jgi:undecaprenyl-diphosphatase
MLPYVPEVSGWAFPSGHAMNGVIVYGMLTYVLQGRLGAGERRIILMIATGLVLAIGFSRIYLGAHYLSDVLAGYASGLFWLALCISVFEVLGQGFSSLHSFKGERHGKIHTG